jgi:hypothetical protein
MNQQGVSNSLNDIVDLMLGFLRVSLYTLSVLLPAGCVQQNTMGLILFQETIFCTGFYNYTVINPVKIPGPALRGGLLVVRDVFGAI